MTKTTFAISIPLIYCLLFQLQLLLEKSLNDVIVTLKLFVAIGVFVLARASFLSFCTCIYGYFAAFLFTLLVLKHLRPPNVLVVSTQLSCFA